MKKLILLLAASAVIASSCSKDDLVVRSVQSMNIDGYVYDADGNTPMEKVTVTSKFGETKTDKFGHFKIDNVSTGTVQLTFKRDSFATITKNAIYQAASNTMVPDNSTVNINVSLYRLDQTLTTTLYYQTDTNKSLGITKIAANAEYELLLPPNFIPNKKIGKADDKGMVKIEGLPKGAPQCSIKFKLISKGYTFTKDESFTKTEDVDKFYVLTEEKGPKTQLVIVESNVADSAGRGVKNFAKAGNITITFNDAINTDIVKLKTSIVLTKDNTSENIAVDYTWSADKKTITIDPVGDYLETGAKYTLDIKDLEALNSNDKISKTIKFKVDGIPSLYTLGQVAGVTIVGTVDTMATLVNVKFLKVDKASEYVVYGQYGDIKEYSKLSSVESANGDTIKLAINLETSTIKKPAKGFFPTSTSTYNIIIRAENNGVIGAFSSVVEVKQKK